MKPDTAAPLPQERTGREKSNQASTGGSARQTTAWRREVYTFACGNCDARFLTTGASSSTCPNCFQAQLSRVEESTIDSVFGDIKPELVEPFRATQELMERSGRAFAGGIPLAPADLNVTNLVKRLQRVFVPAWLVDVTAEARWWAEAGFDYQIVSHIDSYDEKNGGDWTSRQITETRTRWESRLGTLNHTFSNLLLPALEERQGLAEQVCQADPAHSVPYSPSAIDSTVVRLPDQAHDDVWSQATPQLQQMAAELCRQAIGAEHLRLYRWQSQYPVLNWTLLLLPIYTSFYIDDDGTPQVVCFHGASAAATGERRASMRRAKHLATILAGIGTGLFIIGMILMLAGYLAVEQFFPIGALIAIIGMLPAMAALAPLLIVWHFNRQQRKGSHKAVRPNSLNDESR